MPKLRFSLKSFLFSGLLWLLLALSARGVWLAGTFAVRQVRRFGRLIELIDSLPDGGGPVKPFFKWRRQSGEPLETWIAETMPRETAAERAAAARAFTETAAMLRAGDLLGERDAFAELTSRLTAAVDRGRWYSFLTGLSERLSAEIAETADPSEIAGLLDRAAKAISSAAGAGGAASPAPVRSSCPPGACYRYF